MCEILRLSRLPQWAGEDARRPAGAGFLHRKLNRAKMRVDRMKEPVQPSPAAKTIRTGKICIAIQGDSPAAMLERATRALAQSRFLEFRLDSLTQPASMLPRLKRFLAENRSIKAIGTCRRKQGGGMFGGSLGEELELLVKAARAGCSIVDLEIESAEETTGEQVGAFRAALTRS